MKRKPKVILKRDREERILQFKYTVAFYTFCSTRIDLLWQTFVFITRSTNRLLRWLANYSEFIRWSCSREQPNKPWRKTGDLLLLWWQPTIWKKFWLNSFSISTRRIPPSTLNFRKICSIGHPFSATMLNAYAIFHSVQWGLHAYL